MTSKKRDIYKPPPAEDYSRNYCKLIIVIIISLVFIAGEFIGGYISGSISVISDAFHLVTDLLGFVISFVFIYFSRKEPTQKMSFGFHRMELIGALGNLFIIWFLALFMIYEASDRVINREFVHQPLAMLIIGVGGLVINIIMFFVLHSGSHSHGLMAEQCNHDHQPNDSHQQFTTSFCKQMICEDEICLKQVNEPHCHRKNIEGPANIHIHQNPRKKSNQIVQGGNEQTMNNLNQNNSGLNKSHVHQGHKHGENCKHDHKSHKSSKVQNQHLHQHKHQKGEKCEHSKELKGHQCSGNHKHNHKSHDHDHDHHDHHDHSQHNHGHSHEHENHESISMKAAVLHALSDVIQSIGLLISSLIIFFLGSNNGATVNQWNDWHYLDPISTYIFSIIVICSTFPIVKNCYHLIMESTPSIQKARLIQKQFEQTIGVIDVHDLHIWDLRPGKTLLIAHVFAKQGAEREVLTKLTEICRQRKIYHSTLQVQEHNWKNHDDYILCDHDIH